MRAGSVSSIASAASSSPTSTSSVAAAAGLSWSSAIRRARSIAAGRDAAGRCSSQRCRSNTETERSNSACRIGALSSCRPSRPNASALRPSRVCSIRSQGSCSQASASAGRPASRYARAKDSSFIGPRAIAQYGAHLHIGVAQRLGQQRQRAGDLEHLDSPRRFETELQCGVRPSALDGDSRADDGDVPTLQRPNPTISFQPENLSPFVVGKDR